MTFTDTASKTMKRKMMALADCCVAPKCKKIAGEEFIGCHFQRGSESVHDQRSQEPNVQMLALDTGAFAFIAKPLDGETFLETAPSPLDE